MSSTLPLSKAERSSVHSFWEYPKIFPLYSSLATAEKTRSLDEARPVAEIKALVLAGAESGKETGEESKAASESTS